MCSCLSVRCRVLVCTCGTIPAVPMNELTILLSAVTGEFRSYRDELRQKLTRPNVSVKVQDDFIDTGTTTLKKLDTYIQRCDVVIHLIGTMTGSMANDMALADIREFYPDLSQRLPALGQALDDGTRLSYTQWEAYLAIYHRKTLLLAQAEPHSTRDDAAVDEPAQAALQQSHAKRLRALGYYGDGLRFKDSSELIIGIYRSIIYDKLREASGLARAAA